MKKRFRYLSLAMAALLLLGSLAGCGGESGGSGDQGGQGATKDSIKIAIPAEPTGLDPQNAEDTNSQRVLMHICEPLVRLDKDMNYVPGLAEKWEISPDGLTYTFYLRKDVKAHNGDTLTAEDVKYTLERGAASAKVEKAFRSIDTIEIVDDNTVALHLKYVSPVTLGYLSSPSAGIVNRRAAEEMGDTEFNKAPVGYGPYQYADWQSGSKVVLEAFEDYYGGKPAIQTAEFVVMTDSGTAAIALEKGEVDLLVEVSTTDVARLEGNDQLTVYTGDSLIGNLFHMNCLRKPFDDVKVRQAINYAVDKQAIIDATLDGIGGTVMESYIPEKSMSAKFDTGAYPYDPEKAKELLKEAGYENGFECTVSTQQGTNEKIAQVVQSYLAAVGIKMNIEIYEWGSLLALTANDEYDMTIMRIVAMIPDPDLSLYTRFHSTEANNYSNYRDAKLDQMLDEARTCADPEQRTQMYLDINTYLHDAAPVVPMFYKAIIDASDANLKGYHTDPRNFINLDELSW